MKLTTKNLAVKRLTYLVGALAFVAGTELIMPGTFDWQVVLDGGKVALGYWLLATFRDWRDPKISNR